jgi:uncharacterized protein (TIGR00369 family)
MSLCTFLVRPGFQQYNNDYTGEPMQISTHQKIDASLCGHPVTLQDGYCEVELTTLPMMAADDSGLIHGGFIFGLADYAAMLAINHPNVVLGSARSTFVSPVRAGDILHARAQAEQTERKKRSVHVEVFQGETKVFEGEFICFVLEKHVLR